MQKDRFFKAPRFKLPEFLVFKCILLFLINVSSLLAFAEFRIFLYKRTHHVFLCT